MNFLSNNFRPVKVISTFNLNHFTFGFFCFWVFCTHLQAHNAASAAFIENKGQLQDQQGNFRRDIQFLLQGKETSVFLMEKGITYQFFKKKNSQSTQPDNKPMYELYRMDMTLEGAQSNCKIVREEPDLEIRNDLRLGITGIRAYKRITYQNIYPNIDWVIYTLDKGFKHEFIVHPGGNPSHIKMKYKHQNSIQLENNKLVVSSSLGDIIEEAPITWQSGKIIPSAYLIQEEVVSFQLGDFSSAHELVIDPSISWATYFGGNSYEEGGTSAADLWGNVYLAGYTQTNNSSQIATSGGYQVVFGGGYQDAYLVKFDSNGQRIWSTYFGGESVEANAVVKTDRWGNVYLTGITHSATGISTLNAHQTSIGSTLSPDAYLAKFDSSGNLRWATYYGGFNHEQGNDIEIDSEGNTYLVGQTTSSTGIGYQGYQTNYFNNGHSAFLVKFDSTGVRQWGTYYQSPVPFTYSLGYSVVVDTLDNIYIAGRVEGDSFATAPYLNTYQGNDDAFIAKFSPLGNLVWCTYFGGEQDEEICFLKTDNLGNLYLFGETQSATHISTGGRRDTLTGTQNTYLAKFNYDGLKLWSTYMEFHSLYVSGAMTILQTGNIAVGGALTDSSGYTYYGLHNPILPRTYNNSGYAEYDSSGHKVWSDLTAVVNIYRLKGMASDIFGNLYLSGNDLAGFYRGDSLPFNTYKNTFADGGLQDAALVKINLNAICTPADKPMVSLSADTICVGQTVTLTIQSGNLNNATAWHWYNQGCGQGYIQTGSSIQISPTSDTTIYVFGAGGCPPAGECDTLSIFTIPAIGNNILSSSQTLCAPGTPLLITGMLPSGGNSIYSYSWESSNDNFSWSPINDETNANFQPPYLTDPIRYRRIVNSDFICAPSVSNELLIAVYNTASNIIGNNQTVMPNTLPSALSGPDPGNINLFEWQISYDSILWTSISGATQAAYNPPYDTLTTWYRRIMFTGFCDSLLSNIVRLTAAPRYLTVNPPITICEGDSINLQVSSSSPTPVLYYSWNGPYGFYEFTQNPSIPNATNNNIGNYTATAYYQDGTSEIGIVAVNVNLVASYNQISSNQTIQINAQPSLLSGPNPGSGYSYQWQLSLDSLLWQNIAGETQANYQPAYDSTTRWFRRILYSTTCDSSISNPVIITLYQRFLTVVSPVTVCEGGVINLQASTNYPHPIIYFYWNGPYGFYEYDSLNPSITNVNTNQSGNYTLDIYYSDGNQETASVIVTVYPTVSNTISSNQTIPANTQPVSLNGSSINGYSFQWEQSLDSISWTIISGETQSNYQPGLISTTTWFRRIVYSNVCDSISNIVRITTAGSTNYLSVTSPIEVCQMNPIYLGVSSSAPIAVSYYSWAGPNGFSQIGQNPSISNSTNNHSGLYTVTAHFIDGTTESTTINVTVVTRIIFISHNTPCEGGVLTITATPVPEAVYSWTGPNGFTSTLSELIFPNALPNLSGIYSLLVSYPSGVCPNVTSQINVRVNRSPNSIPSSNSPVCSGNAIYLNSGSLQIGSSILWTGPNGFSSTLPNPSISNSQTIHSGFYSLSISVSGCPTVTTSTQVVVNQNPSLAVLTSNQPVCVGNSLLLSVNLLPNATYTWTGPLGFTASGNSVIRNPATKIMNGVYQVQVSVPGCPTFTRSISVSLIPALTVNASSNSPICKGSVLYLSTTPISGASYSWTGPAGYAAQTATATRSNAQTFHSGLYSLVVSSVCGTTSTTVPVTVYPALSDIRISTAQTVCMGSSLTLTGTFVSGATHTWTKPGFPNTSGSTLAIPVVNMTHQGSFSYNVTIPFCGSITRNVNVTVLNGAALVGNVTSPVCTNAPIYMSASYIVGATYLWQTPDGFQFNTQNASRIKVRNTAAGIYTLTANIPACGPVILNFPVTVIQCREGEFEEKQQETIELMESSISIAPNPFTHQIEIQAIGMEIHSLELSDINGKIIEQWAGKKERIELNNLQALPSGFYLLRYTSDKGSGIRKIIKE